VLEEKERRPQLEETKGDINKGKLRNIGYEINLKIMDPQNSTNVAACSSSSCINLNTKQAIKLNIGGHLYQTSMSTIQKYPSSYLADYILSTNQLYDTDGNIFIDRDGKLFGFILNFMRDGMIVELPTDQQQLQQLRQEAIFYRIGQLVKTINVHNMCKDVVPSDLYDPTVYKWYFDHARLSQAKRKSEGISTQAQKASKIEQEENNDDSDQ